MGENEGKAEGENTRETSCSRLLEGRWDDGHNAVMLQSNKAEMFEYDTSSQSQGEYLPVCGLDSWHTGKVWLVFDPASF